MKKSLCDKCGKNITNNNFKKHVESCSPKIKKIRGIDFDPNWGYVAGTRTAWNKGLHGHPKCKRDNTWMKGKTHSKETKEKLSDRKSTRLNSSHVKRSRMPSSA